MQSESAEATDEAVFAACLRRLRAQNPPEEVGFFGPDSMHWRLFREPTLLLGGLRAILLQVANPLIGAGIAANSNFRSDLLGRARRTFVAMYELVFGGREEALEAARRVHNVHRRVEGTASAAEGNRWAGKHYRALCPELQAWVLGTCMDSAMLTHETFVEPVSAEDKERFYQESQCMALQFGLLPETRPASWAAFQRWMADELEGDGIVAGPTALELATDLFNSKYTRGPLDEVLTAGLLPPRWREAYGLRWGAAEQRGYAWGVRGIKAAVRGTPETLRHVTAYHQALYRIALARGQPASRYAWVLNRLDAWVDLPFSIRPVAAHGKDGPYGPGDGPGA